MTRLQAAFVVGRRGERKIKTAVRDRRSKWEPQPLLDLVQAQRQAGFSSAGGAFMNHTFFGGFIKGGRHVFQSLGSFILLPSRDEGEILLLERVETGFDAAILRVFAGAAPHAAFG